jgi:hypothetical protein
MTSEGDALMEGGIFLFLVVRALWSLFAISLT